MSTYIQQGVYQQAHNQNNTSNTCYDIRKDGFFARCVKVALDTSWYLLVLRAKNLPFILGNGLWGARSALSIAHVPHTCRRVAPRRPLLIHKVIILLYVKGFVSISPSRRYVPDWYGLM